MASGSGRGGGRGRSGRGASRSSNTSGAGTRRRLISARRRSGELSRIVRETGREVNQNFRFNLRTANTTFF